MNTLKCLIADDEPIARQLLGGYIAEIPYLESVASCKDAFEVMEVLGAQPVDILFLDINMPKLSGLSLLKTLARRPHVIITTAYPEYAVEGFELSVTDYLLKPFSLERFLQAVGKVQQQMESPKEVGMGVPEPQMTSLFVKSDKKLVKVELQDLVYAEAYGNYVKIYTDTMILTAQTLSDFLTQLPPNFLRIHKSYIINFDCLKLIDGHQVLLKNGTKLPVGKSYRKDILGRI